MRKLTFVLVLSTAGVLFVYGSALADVCAVLGLPAGCVETVDIKNNAVRSPAVKNNNLKSADIKNDSLTAEDLANGSVGSSEIKDGAVNGNELASIRVVSVECNGNCADSTLKQICGGLNWRPIAVDCSSVDSDLPGVNCGGNNLCHRQNIKDSNPLSYYCDDVTGWDAQVYCMWRNIYVMPMTTK